jgi:hypothetical protein
MDGDTTSASPPQEEETSPILPAADEAATSDSVPQAGVLPIPQEPALPSPALADPGPGPSPAQVVQAGFRKRQPLVLKNPSSRCSRGSACVGVSLLAYHRLAQVICSSWAILSRVSASQTATLYPFNQ